MDPAPRFRRDTPSDAGWRPRCPRFLSSGVRVGGLATLCWCGAAYGGRIAFLGRDMVEGLLSFVGLLWLAAFEMLALLFTLTTAFELRRRNSPRAALATGLVAVAGVVVTIVFVLWVATSTSQTGP